MATLFIISQELFRHITIADVLMETPMQRYLVVTSLMFSGVRLHAHGALGGAALRPCKLLSTVSLSKQHTVNS